jgi:CheY-like chemotaxis protein
MPNEPSHTSSVPPSCRVLVVDDNVDGADMLATLLRLDGVEARAVYDGGSALDVATLWRPTAALLDLSMPTMDGFHLAAALRSLPEGRAMRLIALTGWSTQEVRDKCIGAGFDEVLLKPLDLAELYRALPV